MTAPPGWYLADSETDRAPRAEAVVPAASESRGRLVRHWGGAAWGPDVALEGDQPTFPAPPLVGEAFPLPRPDRAVTEAFALPRTSSLPLPEGTT